MNAPRKRLAELLRSVPIGPFWLLSTAELDAVAAVLLDAGWKSPEQHDAELAQARESA